MENLINKSAYERILNRIKTLHTGAGRQWGKMTVNEMICHVSDPIRDILGIRNTPLAVPVEMRPQIVQMVVNEVPFNRDLPTFPAYLQGEAGGGTKPSTFEADKKALEDLVTKFFLADPGYQFHTHAGLGVLSKEEFGLYLWKHLDHHLRQFNA